MTLPVIVQLAGTLLIAGGWLADGELRQHLCSGGLVLLFGRSLYGIYTA